MSLQSNQKGFTIVELLIVIVVIAILAAISIVAYTGIQQRARNSSAFSLASQIAKKADAYYAINGSYPTTAAQFNNTTNKEPNLEGLKVTLTTNTAPTTVTPATTTTVWGSVTADQTTAHGQFQSGNRVIYTGNGASTGGYVVTYLKDSGIDTIVKGTAATGTGAFGSNENL